MMSHPVLFVIFLVVFLALGIGSVMAYFTMRLRKALALIPSLEEGR